MEEAGIFPIVTFVEEGGSFSFTAGDFSFQGGRPLLIIGGKAFSPRKWKRVKEDDKRDSFVGKTSHGVWHFSMEVTPENVTFFLEIDLVKVLPDFELLYMENGSIAHIDHVSAFGMRSGEKCGFFPAGKEKKAFRSMNVMFTAKGRQMFFSYPLAQASLPCTTGVYRDHKGSFLRSGVRIRQNDTHAAAPPLTVSFGDGFQLLSSYGEKNAPEEKTFPEKPPCGWNSWDYYRWTVTEDAILENAEFIASDPVLSRHVKRIIVDDGWQYAYGEWEPNSLFPSGMESLAGKIRKLGFTPGLWIAPFIVEPHARIAQIHYDMLARTEKGLPGMFFNCMERRGFLLDPTVEKTRDFWHGILDRYASMGYGYFKLDFLAPIYDVPHFADETIPRGRLLDLLFRTAKDAIGSRGEIMACGYLRSCGPGHMTAARIGEDIHATWGSIKANTPSLAAYYWANKKLWINDPDFALCRTVDTRKDPDVNRLRPCLCYIRPDNDREAFYDWKLVENHLDQAKVLLSLVIASGGAVNLSDRMSRLDERELILARRTVSAEAGEAAIPLDLFSSELPGCWLQKTLSGYRLLLINWSEEEKEISQDLGALGLSGRKVTDFWTDENIALENGRLSPVLPPRSCLFAVIG